MILEQNYAPDNASREANLIHEVPLCNVRAVLLFTADRTQQGCPVQGGFVTGCRLLRADDGQSGY